MSSEKSKFLVGMFIIVGGSLALILFIWLGASKFLEKGYIVLTYFDESVQGLNIDAPVKYRGVPVGRVVDIKVAPDYRLIEVAMKIEKDYDFQKGGSKSLVATLKNIGITGSMYIELNRLEKSAIKQSPDIDFSTEDPVIPSRPSNVSRIINNVDQTINNINQFDVQGISERIKIALDHFNRFISQAQPEKLNRDLENVLSGMNELVNDPRWKKLLNITTQTSQKIGLMTDLISKDMQGLKKILQTIEITLKSNKGVLASTLRNLNSTSKVAGHLMKESRMFVEQERIEMKTLHKQLLDMSQNLQDMSQHLLELVESIQNQPSRILFADPPKPRKIEEKQ